MKFLKMKTLDEARRLIEERFCDLPLKTEQLPIAAAAGRICAKDIYAPEDIPAFERSAVDGYAVCSADTYGASESIPSLLEVVDEVPMGGAAQTSLRRGEAVYVPTGGMLPEGADTMVMIEYTEKFSDSTVAISRPTAPNSHVMHRGDDCKQGSLLIERGCRLTALHIGILAASGIAEVTAYAPLRCFILSTGDELRPMEGALPLGCIRDTNSYTIGAELTRYGCIVSGTKIVDDSLQAIQSAIAEGLAESDVLIMSGGSSVGDKDYTHAAITGLEDGEVLIHGISIKPGKPTIIGRVGEKPIFGLPGQTVSAFVIYKAIVEHFFDALFGLAPPQAIKAILTDNVHAAPGKATFQCVQLVRTPLEIQARPVYGKSGLIRMLLSADGYFVMPENEEGFYEGRTVDVFALN